MKHTNIFGIKDKVFETLIGGVGINHHQINQSSMNKTNVVYKIIIAHGNGLNNDASLLIVAD